MDMNTETMNNAAGASGAGLKNAAGEYLTFVLGTEQ
jgi:hypothetical protein